jgi:hypothetical protein
MRTGRIQIQGSAGPLNGFVDQAADFFLQHGRVSSASSARRDALLGACAGHWDIRFGYSSTVCLSLFEVAKERCQRCRSDPRSAEPFRMSLCQASLSSNMTCTFYSASCAKRCDDDRRRRLSAKRNGRQLLSASLRRIMRIGQRMQNIAEQNHQIHRGKTLRQKVAA